MKDISTGSSTSQHSSKTIGTSSLGLKCKSSEKLWGLNIFKKNSFYRSNHVPSFIFICWKRLSKTVVTLFQFHCSVLLYRLLLLWRLLFSIVFRKKRKTWLGTISGTLSHWSGDIFRSGLNVLKESGWWALVDERLPADLIATGKMIKIIKLHLSLKNIFIFVPLGVFPFNNIW